MSYPAATNVRPRRIATLRLGAIAALFSAACTTGTPPPEGDAGAPELRDATVDAGDLDAGAPRCSARCGRGCCEANEECVAAECVPRCELRCGDTCCGGDQLCVGGACFTPTEPCTSHHDCADDQVCEPLVGLCVPLPDGASCRYVPEPGVFQPSVEWQASVGHVSTLPLVIRTHDDDGDGRIGASDVPDVVVISHDSEAASPFQPTASGRLAVLSGRDGSVIGRGPEGIRFVPWAPPAAADIDGDGAPEIFALTATEPACDYLALCTADSECADRLVCTDINFPRNVCCSDGPAVALGGPLGVRVSAFGADDTGNPVGRLLWTSTVAVRDNAQSSITIADLEGDGEPEVVTNHFALDARTGERRWSSGALIPARDRHPDATLPSRYPDLLIAMDLDGDGGQEVYRSDTSVDATGHTRWLSSVVPRGHAAPGELLSSHPGPELFVDNGYLAALLDPATGAVLAGPYRHEPDDGFEYVDGAQAGPPVVADFDGDGDTEVAIYTQHGIDVYDWEHDATNPVRWRDARSTDFGSTALAVFDFDADGRSEILVVEDHGVRALGVRDGMTQLIVLWSEAVEIDTVFQFPVVADVDLDGNAELVVTTSEGIRVYGDTLDNWVPTRTILNQHAYYIDNVNEDGSVPRTPLASTATHGLFRAQRLADPDAITLAPDLVIDGMASDTLECPASSIVYVRVRNRGGQGVPSGITVRVYAGADDAPGAELGETHTRGRLLSGQAEWVEVEVAPGFGDGEFEVDVHARVDPEGDFGMHRECDEANNVSMTLRLVCPEII
ncbi:MAG: FG-GAP-like repeat-containing protein [Sandaracinaceae bacterium]